LAIHISHFCHVFCAVCTNKRVGIYVNSAVRLLTCFG